MIKCFKYKNAKGETANRICNVVHVSDTEIRGFDYNKLSQAEQDMVNKVYPDKHKPTPVPTGSTYGTMDYSSIGITKEVFTKAYRIFKKKQIVG